MTGILRIFVFYMVIMVLVYTFYLSMYLGGILETDIQGSFLQYQFQFLYERS